MAIYKIFPTQDSTLYSLTPDANFGMDAILEASNIIGVDGTPDVARFLTQFDTDEIVDVINNKIVTGSTTIWDVNFRTFIAEASGISNTQTLEIYPAGQPWNNGTGEFGDSPETTDGCTWADRSSKDIDAWSMASVFDFSRITGSFDSTYSVSGGGNWIYETIDNPYIYRVTQSFALRSNKDLNVSTKTIVNNWYDRANTGDTGEGFGNYGFLVKLSSTTGSTIGAEFFTTSSQQPIFKYYSVDTNTIYPPQLEFKWRDFTTVLTGSLTSSIVTDSNLKMSLAENPGMFNINSINRFRLNVSPMYPPRTFQTSSFFLGKNFLPTASFYALKDLDTDEYVIDFDTQYTQISADADSNYFDIYMNGLEPERYYKLLIKTNIDGSTRIYDDNYYFKIING